MIAVVVRQGAETDVADAQLWYTREGHHLGIAFVEEFARTVERISERPDQFPEVDRDVRRALLHRFPYATYFVRRVDSAILIAVLHQRRRPDVWRARARVEGAGG